VSKALDPLLKDRNENDRLDGVRACQRWGTEQNVAELKAMLKIAPSHRAEIEVALQAIERRPR
ncbi:MAG: hypothetical protein ACRC33_24645, partial [Gemmataceae bacterium]